MGGICGCNRYAEETAEVELDPAKEAWADKGAGHSDLQSPALTCTSASIVPQKAERPERLRLSRLEPLDDGVAVTALDRVEFESGSTYKGEWKRGIQHGMGRMQFPDGTIKEG